MFLTESHPLAQRTFIHHRVYFREEASYFLTNHNIQADTISAFACSWPEGITSKIKPHLPLVQPNCVVPLGPKSAMTDKDGGIWSGPSVLVLLLS